jgi:hypothetical protein
VETVRQAGRNAALRPGPCQGEPEGCVGPTWEKAEGLGCGEPLGLHATIAAVPTSKTAMVKTAPGIEPGRSGIRPAARLGRPM